MMISRLCCKRFSHFAVYKKKFIEEIFGRKSLYKFTYMNVYSQYYLFQ